MLRGSAELLDFVRGIGINSIVRTKQLSDLPNPSFLREFYVSSPESVLVQIEARHRAQSDAIEKLLDGEPLTDEDQRALSPLEHFVLGASELTVEEGVRRVREWFEERGRRKRA